MKKIWNLGRTNRDRRFRERSVSKSSYILVEAICSSSPSAVGVCQGFPPYPRTPLAVLLLCTNLPARTPGQIICGVRAPGRGCAQSFALATVNEDLSTHKAKLIYCSYVKQVSPRFSHIVLQIWAILKNKNISLFRLLKSTFWDYINCSNIIFLRSGVLLRSGSTKVDED